MKGEYYCPHCHRTQTTREDDPHNCARCGHMMYWRPFDGETDNRCPFCGAPVADGHYWFCKMLDEEIEVVK